jgi:hypothetical protein
MVVSPTRGACETCCPEFECAFTCDMFEALYAGIVAAGSLVRAKSLLGRRANTISATRAWRWPKMNAKRRVEDKNGLCGVYTLYRLRTGSPLQYIEMRCFRLLRISLDTQVSRAHKIPSGLGLCCESHKSSSCCESGSISLDMEICGRHKHSRPALQYVSSTSEDFQERKKRP